jgi:hypothetical protein
MRIYGNDYRTFQWKIDRNYVVSERKIAVVTDNFPRGARLLNTRFENKYLIPERDLFRFKQEVLPFLKRDPFSQSGEYEVRSLYLDTPDFRMADEVTDGEANRLKIRFRKYAWDAQTGYLETKRKLRFKMVKNRVKATWEEVESLIEGRFKSEIPDHFMPFAFAIQKGGLVPNVSITYNREAYLDRFGGSLRVTVDRNIRCGPPETFFRPVSKDDARVLPIGMCVLEVKFENSVPRWMSRAVKQCELRLTPYSKYEKSVRRLLGKPLFSGELNYGSVT